MPGVSDDTGNIGMENDTNLLLSPGYYFISYSVSAVLDDAGYMQITPYYSGAPHIEYGAYFKTSTGASSAYVSNSIIIYVPEHTAFTLNYNCSTSSRSGAATVGILKLSR